MFAGAKRKILNYTVGKKFTPFHCLVILLTLFFCTGWNSTWNELKLTMDQIHSVQADFVQEKHMPILRHPLVSNGKLFFKTPDSLRWEYQSPVQSILIMNRHGVKRFFKGETGLVEDASVNLQAMQIVIKEIGLWLNGRFTESKTYEAELVPGEKIILTPKDEALKKMIQRIELTLSTQEGIIDSVIVYEDEDQYTLLRFLNTQINQDIPDDLFDKP